MPRENKLQTGEELRQMEGELRSIAAGVFQSIVDIGREDDLHPFYSGVVYTGYEAILDAAQKEGKSVDVMAAAIRHTGRALIDLADSYHKPH